MMTISYPEGTTVSGEIIKLDDFVVITRTYSNGVKIMLRESENGVSINITGLEEEQYNKEYIVKSVFLILYINICLTKYSIKSRIITDATKNGRTVLSNLGVQAQSIQMVIVPQFRKEILPMITLSYEALIALVGLCGGAGYLLGKDIQKAKK